VRLGKKVLNKFPTEHMARKLQIIYIKISQMRMCMAQNLESITLYSIFLEIFEYGKYLTKLKGEAIDGCMK
jgi:hypothetical protein